MSISFDNTKTKVGASFDIALKDEFMFFVWNGFNSRAYNCFIENKNDLTFTPHPSFTNNFETPLYQNTRYTLGTTTEGKEIELNLCFYNITLKEFNDVISNWLQIGKTALFQYEYEDDYGYNCRLKTVGNAKKYINGTNSSGEYLYIIEVSISFETTEDSYALYKNFTVYTESVNVSIKDSTTNITRNKIDEDSFLNDEEIFSCSCGLSDNKKTYYIGYSINNNGSLNCPFEIAVSNINNGGTLTIYKNLLSSFISGSLIDKDIIAKIECNASAETSTLKYVYESNTGLITIGDQPANMVIVNSQEPLSYNMCFANQYLTPGENYIWVVVNNFSTSTTKDIIISISFRKRKAVI